MKMHTMHKQISFCNVHYDPLLFNFLFLVCIVRSTNRSTSDKRSRNRSIFVRFLRRKYDYRSYQPLFAWSLDNCNSTNVLRGSHRIFKCKKKR